jgi:NAD(P)-dependent dehydrogenase (short-subunit alcohol dehydrogenase family)
LLNEHIYDKLVLILSGVLMAEQIAEMPVAVVTGASSHGFGEAIVRRLADGGWRTIAIGRRADRLQDLAEEVGGEFEVCDISDPYQVRDTARGILDRHEGIDLLVNNAGMALRGDYREVTAYDATRVMQTNYFGTLNMTEALRPGLERAAPADVIHVISAAGAIANPHSAPYSASKHAQLGLSRLQTVSLRPLGIHVHAILPGKANTEGHPQEPSSSPFSRLTRTDIDSVADAVIARIGERPKEVYVPRRLKLGAVANTLGSVTTGRVVNRFVH